MEAVSQHLERFSAGLFEELMRFPYHIPTGASASTLVNPKASLQARLQKRYERFKHVRDHPLDNR